jgi:hypothetical protein
MLSALIVLWVTQGLASEREQMSGPMSGPMSGRIQPGLWQFDADRHIEVRALMLKKHIQRQTRRCLSADPLAEILSEMARKGCRAQARVATAGEKLESGEPLQAGAVVLHGGCELSILPGQELPMTGALRWISATQFSLQINAGRAGLSYREGSTATRVADCPASP